MNSVILNNVDHADLRVKPGRGPEYGDAVNQVAVALTEFQDVQRDFPIMLRKDEVGDWQTVALLGFSDGENLFLQDGNWTSRYVPAILARGAFSIGLSGSGADTSEPMVNIDLDFPGVGDADGHRLFLDQGGNAPYLEYVTNVLRRLYEGMAITKPFLAALDEHELIEPVEISADASEQLKFVVKGFSVVSQEKLYQLDAEALHTLNQAGHLFPAHLMMASLSNIPRLIELKNRVHESRPVE